MLDDLLGRTFERLDAQGAALLNQSQSIQSRTRVLEPDLLAHLTGNVLPRIERHFAVLITQDGNEQAGKQAQAEIRKQDVAFQRYVNAALGRIETRQVEQDAKLDRILERVLADAEKDKKISAAEARALEAEAEREKWKELYRKLQEEVRERTGGSVYSDEWLPAHEFGHLLKMGELSAAEQLKEEQIAARNGDLARDYFELGTVRELRYDFARALEAYGEAWRLERKPEFGFKYAYCAQKQNQFGEAISAYEETRRLHTDAADVAMTLNNLVVLYSATQRMEQAEQATGEATQILDPLWRANPTVHGNQMARILLLRAVICGLGGDGCALGRQAWDAAYEPTLKQTIQKWLDENCSA